MRTEFDFSPLFRTTVGFDRMVDALRGAMRVEAGPDGFPPYDIERIGEDRYRLTLAVAGFREDELRITAHPNLLVVAGEHEATRPQDQGEQPPQTLHRGIAARAFEGRFELADHVQVVGARLADGLLTIELERQVPEAMRPRRIGIAHGAGAPPRRIEGRAEDPERRVAA